MPHRAPTHQPTGAAAARAAAEREYERRRGNSADRGYGHRWRAARGAYLREHPLCCVCEREGRVAAATVVDHVRPVTGPDDPLFFDTTNWQALCGLHHRQKTCGQDGGFGNVKKPRPEGA